MGQHVEHESVNLGKCLAKVERSLYREAEYLRDISLQNRAYATSQLSDLAQKLAKAQSTVSSTRATLPKIKDEKDKVCLVDCIADYTNTH